MYMMMFMVGGKATQQDCWLVEVLLMIAYDDIYKLVSEPNCCVSDRWVDGEWTMDFKRSLTVQEFNRWLNLKDKLQAVTLSHESNDSVSWALEKKGYFSTRSLYRFLTDRGVTSKVAGYIWRCKIPQKIKFFLWQVFNNKLQVDSSLAKRGWKGDVHCCLCGRIESVNHILFHCYLAKLIWGMIREIFQLDSCPSSLEDFSYMWLQGKGPLPSHLLMFLSAGIAWVLWTTRNKMAIEKHFPKAPSDVVYVAISLLQKWCLLLKEKDKERIDHVLKTLLNWMKNFCPSHILVSDVSEI